MNANAARPSKQRQKLDTRAMGAIFVGYPYQQKRWLALDCDANSSITSIHVMFDESDSDAAFEIKRIELAKLAACTETTFDYYSRTATRTADFLFSGQLPAEEKPTANEVILLDDFSTGFDMNSLNLAVTTTVIRAYAPRQHPESKHW